MKIMSEVQLSNPNNDDANGSDKLKVTYCDLDYLKILFIIVIIILEVCWLLYPLHL